MHVIMMEVENGRKESLESVQTYKGWCQKGVSMSILVVIVQWFGKLLVLDDTCRLTAVLACVTHRCSCGDA